MIPSELIFGGIVLAMVAAIGGASYSGYHHWRIRDPFTAEGFYHNERARLGAKVLIMAGVLLLVLVMSLDISR